MSHRLYIVGTVRGVPTPYDRTWLVDYDPTAIGTAAPGGLLVTSRDPAEARLFPDAAAAMACWRRSNGRTRPDGKPDRPLTAFTVEAVPE